MTKDEVINQKNYNYNFHLSKDPSGISQCVRVKEECFGFCSDLSYNNLSGEVPVNGSFSKFTPVRYPSFQVNK